MMATEQHVNEPVAEIHHCGMALPADELVCPACYEWLRPVFTD